MTERNTFLLLAAMALLLGIPFGLLFLMLMMAGAMASAGAAAGSAVVAADMAKPVLKPGMVPAQYVNWVIRAGNECAAVSAPQIAAQILQESNWQPNVKSGKNAEGIAQFLPSTWQTYGRKDAPGPVSPYNPYDAIMAMGRYDCAIASQVAGVRGDPLSNMLAGYNAGPDSVLQYNGIPPYPETQNYVRVIEAMIPMFAAATPVLAAGPFAQAEITAAEGYLGTPYVWGGGSYTGPTTGLSGNVEGFDCSGLVLYAVYQASGGHVRLPHSSEQQATLGRAVPRSQLAPGDVIAIQENPHDYSHIVIYLGGGQVIQAPEPRANVDIIPLSDFSQYPWAIRWFGP